MLEPRVLLHTNLNRAVFELRFARHLLCDARTIDLLGPVTRKLFRWTYSRLGQAVCEWLP